MKTTQRTRRPSPLVLACAVIGGVVVALACVADSDVLARWMPRGVEPVARVPSVHALVDHAGRTVMIHRRAADPAADTLTFVDAVSGVVLAEPKPIPFDSFGYRPWWSSSTKRNAEGLRVEVITWVDHGIELVTKSDPRRDNQMTRLPGVVFEKIREANALRVIRHDLISGAAREIGFFAGNWMATASDDGERLLVEDTTGRVARTGHEHVRVLDARDGTELLSFESPYSTRWVGGDHRFLSTEWHGRIVVFDLERACRVDLGAVDGLEYVTHLANGDWVVVNGGAVRVHDRESGQALRTL